MDDETIAGEMFEEPEGLFPGFEVLPEDLEQPPDYLVSLYMAYHQLVEARKDILVGDLADTKGRYASIAITDIEKVIAFVSLYLT